MSEEQRRALQQVREHKQLSAYCKSIWWRNVQELGFIGFRLKTVKLTEKPRDVQFTWFLLWLKVYNEYWNINRQHSVWRELCDDLQEQHEAKNSRFWIQQLNDRFVTSPDCILMQSQPKDLFFFFLDFSLSATVDYKSNNMWLKYRLAALIQRV